MADVQKQLQDRINQLDTENKLNDSRAAKVMLNAIRE